MTILALGKFYGLVQTNPRHLKASLNPTGITVQNKVQTKVSGHTHFLLLRLIYQNHEVHCEDQRMWLSRPRTGLSVLNMHQNSFYKQMSKRATSLE